MNEYSTVFTIKVDIHSYAKNVCDGTIMNEAALKTHLAKLISRAEIDGVSIVNEGRTYETKKDL